MTYEVLADTLERKKLLRRPEAESEDVIKNCLTKRVLGSVVLFDPCVVQRRTLVNAVMNLRVS